jgi:hypothetical protein
LPAITMQIMSLEFERAQRAAVPSDRVGNSKAKT